MGVFGRKRPEDAATQHIGPNAAGTTSFRIPRAFTGRKRPLGDAIAYFMPFPSVVFLRPALSSHLTAALCVMAVSLLAALPPALRARRLRPAEALRHV